MGAVRRNDSRPRQLQRKTNRPLGFARPGIQRLGTESVLRPKLLAESRGTECARDRLRTGARFEMAARPLGRNLHLPRRAAGHGRGDGLKLSAVVHYSVDECFDHKTGNERPVFRFVVFAPCPRPIARLTWRPLSGTVPTTYIVDLMNKFAIGCGGLLVILVFIIIVCALALMGSYNRLVGLDQNVNKKWGDVQTVYQRRTDLIPNLVNTVQGAANFEKSTLTDITNARASVGRVQLDPNKAPTDAAQLEQFQAAQGQLSNALSRLLVVVERYPELKSNQSFLSLQAQLEGTENRISVER